MSGHDLVDALKAIAHPVRLRILQVLADAERNVGEIDDAAGIGQPTLSQQLAVLRKAGLVTTRKEAKLVYYSLERDRLDALAGAIGGLTGGAARTAAQAPRKAAPGAANFARLG